MWMFLIILFGWEAILPYAIPAHWCWCILKVGGQGRTQLFYLRYFFDCLCACGRLCRAGYQALFMCVCVCVRFGASLFFLRFLVWPTFIWLFLSSATAFVVAVATDILTPSLPREEHASVNHPHVVSVLRTGRSVAMMLSIHMYWLNQMTPTIWLSYSRTTLFCTFGETSDCAPFFEYIPFFLWWHTPPFFCISLSFLFPYCSSSFVLL